MTGRRLGFGTGTGSSSGSTWSTRTISPMPLSAPITIGLKRLSESDAEGKPFGSRELVARLEAALRRASSQSEEPVMSVDGLAVDRAARTVHCDGRHVHLTPIEYDLLCVLVQNKGRLMTNRALLTEVWGSAYEHDTQTLRTHIANLRRKIEPGQQAPRYIRTDPGVGYRFAALADS